MIEAAITQILLQAPNVANLLGEKIYNLEIPQLDDGNVNTLVPFLSIERKGTDYEDIICAEDKAPVVLELAVLANTLTELSSILDAIEYLFLSEYRGNAVVVELTDANYVIQDINLVDRQHQATRQLNGDALKRFGVLEIKVTYSTAD